MSKEIVAIWAEDENHLIGVDHHMPWHLPSELQHFKNTTSGHTIVMGRVTFDGMNRRLLPNRQVIILTRDQEFDDERVICCHSVEEVLAWYEKQDKSLFIVGGARVYEAFAPYYDRLIRTTVHHQFEGDTYFPDAIDLTDYEEASDLAKFVEKDEKNAYDYTIQIFKRK